MTLEQLEATGLQLSFEDDVSVDLLVGPGLDDGAASALSFQQAKVLTFELEPAAYCERGVAASKALRLLLQSLRRQLAAARSADSGATFRCFGPEELGFAVVCSGVGELSRRAELHQLLRLPERPLFRPAAALPWRAAHPLASGKLLSPHRLCGREPGWWRGGPSTRSGFVRGHYEYCHYSQDGVSDDGWGCAYRSLQTCVSWYALQSYVTKGAPGILEIQEILKRIDETHKDIRVGSGTWIGTIEGMYVLQDYLGVDCRQMYCHDADDMVQRLELVIEHFHAEGSPVMMGVGQKAFTIVGLCWAGDQVALLIVDPHYIGVDEPRRIVEKAWVGWKGMDFIRKEAGRGFINLCLPLVPHGQDAI